MIALIAIVYAIAMGMIASPVFAQGQDIKSFVSQLYIEGVPYEEATLFDPDAAVPTLLDMLADPNEEQHWPNVVTTLGMLGDARAVEPLIQFLEEDPGKRLSHVHYIAKTGVMMALGYLINKDENQEALVQRFVSPLYSMIKFFVLDVLRRRVVAVSSDPAPDSAFAPSFFGRPSGQLP